LSGTSKNDPESNFLTLFSSYIVFSLNFLPLDKKSTVTVTEDLLNRFVLFQDKTSFEEIYNLLFPKIYKFFGFRIKNQDDTEDLTQETFLVILKRIKTFKFQGNGSFEAWCFRIAKNVLSNFLSKKKRKDLEVSLDSVGFSLKDEKDLERESNIKDILRALDNLKKEYKEVLLYFYIDDLSIEQISKVIGRSENSTKVLLHRARESLKKEFEKV